MLFVVVCWFMCAMPYYKLQLRLFYWDVVVWVTIMHVIVGMLLITADIYVRILDINVSVHNIVATVVVCHCNCVDVSYMICD